ncbi:MAG: DUF3999 family protein [Bacteroidota bacterium]
MFSQIYNRIFLFIFLLASHLVGIGQVDDYQYQRPVTQVRTIGYHQIILPQEVLTVLNDDMSDLRLLQTNAADSLPSTEVPYLIEVQEGENELKEIPFRMINQASKKNFSQAVLRKEGKGAINRIELDIHPRNFDVRASLEGSDNRLSWVTIKDDFRLVGIANPDVSYSYTSLNFSESDYRFFRVKLYDRELSIKGADMHIWTQSEGEYQAFDISSWDPKNDTDQKITEVRIELTSRSPVSRLQVNIGSTRDYYRSAKVEYLKQRIETDDGSREIWRDFASTTLSSLEEPDLSGPVKYTDALRLTIQNHDDLPLDIRGLQVSGPIYRLIAELEVGNQYLLTYGNDNASRPRYDLVHFQNQIPRDDLVPAGLGEEMVIEDPEAEEKEAEEKRAKTMGNVFLWGGMLIVILVIGFMTMRMMQKAKQDKQESEPPTSE